MKTSIKNLIEELQKLNPESTVEVNYYEIPKCPSCGTTDNVKSMSGYGWYCSCGIGAWGRD